MMGLPNRIWQIVRTNVNRLLERRETPEQLLERAVREMRSDLIHLRQAVAGAIATQKQIERERTEAEQTAREWYGRAQLALQKGRESLARDALLRRKSYLDTAAMMARQFEQQGQIVAHLRAKMRLLEAKTGDAEMKADLYIARSRSARSSERLNRVLENLTSGEALDAIEDRVAELEARSQALTGLTEEDWHTNAAETRAEIDAEIEAMKAQLRSNSDNNY
ncbi:PspA/IM30 family protein [Lyngbya sp. CCY1209]|uniref:PspA/IM30 family protein n=1 Tax=Lyngbya sp. CCY1209 TaxID=2886103 RepID=UPI002D1FE0B0|nr:PspA/IM30 family protein [Lyngbya sp. CCY1209]MEB3885904.1 PspA/IM30 family protein [Lyngbya sp. CCY1209]